MKSKSKPKLKFKLKNAASLTLALILLCLAAAAVPNWSELRLDVEPGVGTSELHLNEVVPQQWPKQLGKPDIDFRYADTGEGFRHIYWGDTSKGRLNKGIEIQAIGATAETEIIVDILIRGVRATVSAEKLFIGLPVNRLSKRSKLAQKDDTKTFLLPGLVLEIQDDKLHGIRVSSESSTRWRFSKWTIVPGKEVGPIRIGAVLNDALLQTLGKPDEKSPTRAKWSSKKGAQLLEIETDPRSQAIKRIRGIGLAWRTSEGVTLNDTLSTFLSKHRTAKSDLGRESNQMIAKLPGLRASFEDQQLRGFDIYPIYDGASGGK